MLCILPQGNHRAFMCMTALYHLELLGSCRLADAATGAETEFRTRKAKCLLGVIALSPNLRMSREQLASLLWDPAPEEQARASLRQSLKEIREVLGERADLVLDAGRFDVGLRPGTIAVDARRCRDRLAESASDPAAVIEAAALWHGELFGQLLPSAPVFEAWVQVERSHLRSALTKALTDRLEAVIQAGDFSDARLAEELVRIEPSHELAHQYLMRFHATRGDQAAALRQYALLDRVLAEELDSEPSAESNNLLIAVKRGDIGLKPPPPAAARTTRQGPPKITIRPPLTRYTDSSKDYLGEGFAYLAKVCLSRFRCWIVIPWPSKGYDSDTAVDYTAVGQATGADFTVDCVLDWRAPAGKLFVTLIDNKDSSEVWSNIFTIAENELQEMSATVAGAVAANLASQVNYISLLRYARTVPGSPAAYDLWLKGHQLSRLWDPESDETAEALFLKAIELDPGLACSHASLAAILNTRAMVRPGYARRKQDCATAFRHAQSAIALDPYDSRSHIALAWSWLLASSAERAHSHFKLAVELNPYDSETLVAAALGMAYLGMTGEAGRLAALALSLNPLFPEYFRGYLAVIHYLSGDYRATVTEFEKCPDVFPDLAAWAAAAHARLGEKESAARAYRTFRALTAPKWEGEGALGETALEDWLLDVNPIVWADGRKSFVTGIRQARLHADAAPALPLSGTSA